MVLESRYKNKTIIISGGLGDIARAVAKGFAALGTNIAIGDIHPERDAKETLSLLSTYGVKSRYSQIDVTDYESVKRWFENTKEQLGVPSIVIVNAATATFKSILEISPREWSREIDINLSGAFYFSQIASKMLVDNKIEGVIVFLGSWAGQVIHKDLPAYTISKSAIRMLCKTLAIELAPFRILVNELALGFVDAGLSGKSFKQNAALKEAALNQVPIKRLINVDEVANKIVEMCGPNNTQVTGSTILMDGGLSLITK